MGPTDPDRWLTHATDELQDALDLKERGRYYIALFHLQQATEKALKAFLYGRAGVTEIIHSHSVHDLLALAKEADRDFERVARASRLDEYYISTRYPDGLPGGVPSRFYTDPQQAEEAAELAKGVVDLVRRKLGEG